MFGCQACHVCSQLEHVFLSWHCVRLDENDGIRTVYLECCAHDRKTWLCLPAMEDSWNIELCSIKWFGLLLCVTIKRLVDSFLNRTVLTTHLTILLFYKQAAPDSRRSTEYIGFPTTIWGNKIWTIHWKCHFIEVWNYHHLIIMGIYKLITTCAFKAKDWQRNKYIFHVKLHIDGSIDTLDNYFNMLT